MGLCDRFLVIVSATAAVSVKMDIMFSDESPSSRYFLLAGIALGSLLMVFTQPPFGQDLGYHRFADQRDFLGLPNFFDVISSLPFVFVGVAGVGFCLRNRLGDLRIAWLSFFAGVALVGPGSAFYHWTPSNVSLVLDRLPMTVAFMGLTTAILGEYAGARIGKIMLAPALILGLMSVLYWHWFNDLRLYAWVQFFPLTALPIVVLVFRRRYTGQAYLVAAFVCYLLAKGAENYDPDIFELTYDLVSGHTMKHLLAASGGFAILLMLKNRTRLQ